MENPIKDIKFSVITKFSGSSYVNYLRIESLDGGNINEITMDVYLIEAS